MHGFVLWGEDPLCGVLSSSELHVDHVHAPNVQGMEAVNVFLGVEIFDDCILVDVAGKGKLNQHSINAGITAEVPHCRLQLLL